MVEACTGVRKSGRCPILVSTRESFGTSKQHGWGRGLFVKKRVQSRKASHWLSCYSPSTEGTRGGRRFGGPRGRVV